MTPKTRPKAKRKGKLKGESTSRQPVQKKYCDGRRIWRSEPTHVSKDPRWKRVYHRR